MFVKNHLAKRHATEEGFTLIELMIAVVIIGILAATSIPIFANQQKAAADAVVKTDLKNVSLQYQTYQATHGTLPADTVSLNEMKVQLSGRENYTTETPNYLLTCMDKNHYSIYATSVSGTTFVYSSAKGKIYEEPDFPRGGAYSCPASGIPSPTFWLWVFDGGGNWVIH